MGYDTNGNWTLSFSLNINLNIFWGFSGSISFSVDSNGESAIQLSYSGFTSETPNIGLLDVGAFFSTQITKLSSVDELESLSTYLGGTIGDEAYISADVITASADSEQDGEFIGAQVGVGIGYGVDAHCIRTKTITIMKNPKGLIGKILEWIF